MLAHAGPEAAEFADADAKRHQKNPPPTPSTPPPPERRGGGEGGDELPGEVPDQRRQRLGAGTEITSAPWAGRIIQYAGRRSRCTAVENWG